MAIETTTKTARSTATPAAVWRRLLPLAVLVAVAHAWVLQAAPSSMAPYPSPEAATQAFITRTITLQPTVQPAPALQKLTQLTPAASATAARRASQAPRSPITNQPLRLDKRTSLAIDFVANTTPEVILPMPTEAPAISAPVAVTDTQAPITAATAAHQPEPAPTSSAAVASGTDEPTVVTAISLPSSARLFYKVIGTAKGLNYFADAEIDWRNNGQHYDAVMKVSALFVGSRSMTSSGTITPAGLAPSRFADKYKNELAAHFDAGKRVVTFSANTPDVPWTEGTQDRVSVFLQLGGILAAGAKQGEAGFATGSSITVYTVGPRDADTWTFSVENTEQLSLPSGDMPALKLTRKPKREHDQTVEVWYAPSLGYLPVRNRITQANGDFIDQQLKTITRP